MDPRQARTRKIAPAPGSVGVRLQACCAVADKTKAIKATLGRSLRRRRFRLARSGMSDDLPVIGFSRPTAFGSAACAAAAGQATSPSCPRHELTAPDLHQIERLRRSLASSKTVATQSPAPSNLPFRDAAPERKRGPRPLQRRVGQPSDRPSVMAATLRPTPEDGWSVRWPIGRCERPCRRLRRCSDSCGQSTSTPPGQNVPNRDQR